MKATIAELHSAFTSHPSRPLLFNAALVAVVLLFIAYNPSFESNCTTGKSASDLVLPTVFGEVGKAGARKQVSVVVLVTSRAASRDRRDLLRRQFKRSLQLLGEKMGRDAVDSVVIRFLVGKQVQDKVKAEADEFGDMLFLDCPDADRKKRFNGPPSATTLKVMLGITWAVETYAFDYLFRVGDDAYLRIDYFREQVALGQYPKERLLLGWIISGHPVWGLVYDYPSGMGFVLTFDLCEWIAMSGRTGLLLDSYPEDAVVGRWLFAVKVNKVNDRTGFHDYKRRVCDEKSILIHKLPAEAWDRIDSNGLLDCTV